jgi:hypothetical protein
MALAYSIKAQLTEECPGCNGYLLIIGNDVNNFIGCSTWSRENPGCKNMVKIAKYGAQCTACNQKIEPVSICTVMSVPMQLIEVC